MHVLTHNTYCKCDIRSGVGQIDQLPNQSLKLISVNRVTIFCPFSCFDWSVTWLATKHASFCQQVKDIFSLGNTNSFLGSCNLHSQEVFHLSKIFNFKLFGQNILQSLHFNHIIPGQDYIVDIYNQNCFSYIFSFLEKHSMIRLALLISLTLQYFGKSVKPCSRGLLKAIQRFSEFAHFVIFTSFTETWWNLHVDLFF